MNMSLPIETILGITAAALIGVGSMVVILPNTAKDTAPSEKTIQCVETEKDEAGKCTVKILGQRVRVTSGEMSTEERVTRVEIMAEEIKEKIDSLEEKLREKKDSSQGSSNK